MEVEQELDAADSNIEDCDTDSMMATFDNQNTQSEADTQRNKSTNKLSFQWNAKDILKSMYDMRPNLSDVCLITSTGTRIYAHRSVLASSIPYFATMFLGNNFSSEADCGWRTSYTINFVEKDKFDIVMQDIDDASLQEIVQYCYTGKISIKESTIQSLLSAATMINCLDVILICEKYLKDHLQPNNALGIWTFADMMGCSDLRDYSFTYILNSFAKICNTDNEEFHQLSADRLVKIISSDYLDTGEQGENIVLMAVVNWIFIAPDSRRAHLQQLISHIRFPKFSPEALINLEREYPLIQDEPCYKDLLIEALRYHLLKSACSPGLTRKLNGLEIEKFIKNSGDNFLTGEGCSTSSNGGGVSQIFDLTCSRFRERIRRMRKKCLLVVGGQAPKAIRQCEYLDFSSNKWLKFVQDLPSKKCRSGVTVHNNLVYVVGGFNGQMRVRTVDIFDMNCNQWTQCASLDARRSTLGVCLLNDKIYAIGGFDGTIGLNTAEVYDPIKRIWSYIAPMSTRRSSVGVVALNELLYAVGGYDGASRQCLASVEHYDPSTDVWTTIVDMSQPRSGPGVGVLDDKIYAIGGHDGPAVRKSVECYDPKTGVWTQCADMINARRNAGVVVNDGCLFVIGGDDGQKNLDSIEIYDPKANSWSLHPTKMSIGRSYAGVAIIEKTWN